MENFENLNTESYEDTFSREYDKQKSKFDETVKSKLIISLIGDVNVGKSQTINALTGRKLSEVSGVAGETKNVFLHKFYDDVYIADTPGLDDINESVSRIATEFIHKDTDIILFFIDANSGAKKTTIDTFNSLKNLNKPLLIVLNKIDTWYDHNEMTDVKAYNEVTNQIEKETGYLPIPISAKKNINIKNLNDAICDILQKEDKELLFMKVSRYKEGKVSIWINGATVTAFSIGAIPLPGADIVPLTGLQVGLALKIAYIYNCKVSKEDIMSLMASTITGSVGKHLFKLGVQALKGLGWAGGPIGSGATAALGGTIAASITYAFGWVCNVYYKSGMTINLEELGIVYKEMYENYFQKKKEIIK